MSKEWQNGGKRGEWGVYERGRCGNGKVEITGKGVGAAEVGSALTTHDLCAQVTG